MYYVLRHEDGREIKTKHITKVFLYRLKGFRVLGMYP